MKPLELSSEFKLALDFLEKQGKNLFITGKAGTGKSTLLNLFRDTTKKNIVVLAPTGVAALNVRGQTIHSFFGLPPRMINKTEIKKNWRLKKVFQQLNVLVIDEISMVRADMMDNIDYALRLNRNRMALPFGGVQVVLVGDLFQLPPVVSTNEERALLEQRYETPYFYSADVFKHERFELELFELTKVFRQDSRHFLRLLDAIRNNQFDHDDLEDLNERYEPNFKADEGYIVLTARNNVADNINSTKLRQIISAEWEYTAKLEGTADMKQFPTEYNLQLKVGAQVMFVRNDTEAGYVNGTIGVVSFLSDDEIKVTVIDANDEKREIVVSLYTWEMLRYKLSETDPNAVATEVVGSFKQYPLKLAWAITIHKSQGKTFDRVIVDLGQGGAFEHGQTYVALSRCRTLQGIVLRQAITPKDILVDERIIEFHDKMG